MKASKGTRISEVAMFVILLCIIIVPLVGMLVNVSGEAFKSVFSSDKFYDALLNSLLSAAISTIISISIAYALAWAINRSCIRLKSIWCIVLVLPMLIPSISHGSGLIMLFGNNGIITNLFNLEWSIYGLPGIIIGSVLYSFPVAFLMFSDILKYQDYAPYAAADVLGISKIRQFKTITVPFLKKPFISVLFATFTLIVTDYGIPLSVGGQFKTLPVMLYEEAVGLLNYSAGSVIGLTLLVPAVIAFLVDLLGKDSAKSENVSQKFIITWKTLRDVLCYALCIIVTLFTALIFLSFCIQAFAKSYPNDMSFTFDNFKTTFKRSGLEYLGNSLLISLLTAVVGTALSFVLAYLTARTKTKSSKVLHLMAITSLAIPGLVLGLSYVIVFKKTFFYGSLAILVMVNCVHFLASPYLMVYNAMGKINENIEDVGSILGISRAKIIWKVIIPQTKYTLIEMLSYFFVNSMMTISAVSFLATLGNRPLSLLINQFEARAKMECAAVVAIMIFAVNFIIKVVIGYFKRRGGAR